MSENISHASIVQAIEDHVSSFCLYCSQFVPGAVVHDDEELLSVFVGKVGPNAVVRTRFTSGEPGARVAEVMAPFKASGTSMLWWVWPSTRPITIGAYLEAQGLIYRGEGPGMALRLAEVADEQPLPRGLTIEVVRDRETLGEWLYTGNLAASGAAEDVRPEEMDFEERLGFDRPYRRYLGRVDGRAVGTSALFLFDGAAGISWVTTMPEVRGRGIGTALTRVALVDARAMGYAIAVLLSSPLGFPVYSRMGFREYCRVRSYLWR